MFDHGFLHTEQTALGQPESTPRMLLQCYLDREQSIAGDVLVNLHRH